MAWLSNLAGRAEAFLENLDQAAATSLDKVGIASPQKQTQDYLQEKEMLRKEEAKSFMTSDSFLGPSRPIQAHTKQTSGSVAPNSPTEKKLSDVLKDTSKSDVDEDKLFAFLNSPTTPKSSSPAFGGKKPTRRSAPPKHQTPTRMKSPTTTLKEDTDGFPRRKTSDKSRSSSTSKMPEDHTTVQAHVPTDVQQHQSVDQPHPVDQPPPSVDLRSHTPVDPETHPPSGHRTHPPVDHQTHPLTGSKSNTANTTSQVSTPQSKSPINNVSSPFQPSWLDAFQDTSVMDNGEEHDSQDGVDTRVREGEPIAQPQPSDGNQPYSVDDCRVDDVGVGGGGVDDRRVDDGGVGGGSVGDGGVGGDGVGDDDVKGRVKDEVEDPELTEMRVKLSNLELENQLLRREISSLNEEMSSTGSRLKHLQDSNARYQQEIMLSKERISSLENDLLVSTSALEDANANYSTKCEEFDFLSQKMSIAEQEMKTAKESLLQTTAENSRLVQDASDISGAHHSALNSLRQQLSTAQQNLTRETQAHQKIKDALEEGKRSLSEELAVVKEELRKSQQVLSERTVAGGQLNEKLSATLGNYECLQKEYQEYKHKATTILQAKSQEITKLKSDSRGPPEALEEVQLEKDLLEDKLAKYEVMISDLQGEAKTIEEGAEAEISRLEASLAVAKENLVREQNSHSELQLEMGRLKSELDQSRMELLQQSSALTAKIKEKDEAIEELESRWALMSVPSSPGSGGELESRLQELTESLIQKQTLVETLSSEKHSIQMQLEKMSKELEKKDQSLKVHQEKQSVVISGLDDVEQEAAGTRMRSISSIIPSTIGPSDSSQLSQRVHKAATAVDTFSVRLGVFLRRHPQARLFVIFYGVLLHLWVMFILLAYKPEIHTDANCNSS